MKNRNSTHLFIGFIITLISLLFGYIFYSNLLKKDEQILTSKLNELFEGKSAITDGQNFAPSGDLLEGRRDFYLQSGGFTVFFLTKESGGFVKREVKASHLQYKIDEYEYNYGYKSDNFRPDVSRCYREVFDFMVKGDKTDRNASYSPDKFIQIKEFPEGFSSDFYSIEAAQHPTEFYEEYEGTGGVSNNYVHITTQEIKHYYKLTENLQAKTKALLINILLSLVIGIILSILAKPIAVWLQPNPETIHTVFNKKRRSINKNFIMSFESGFKGNNVAVIVEEGKVKRGTMKFSDNGQSIHISLSDMEYYYHITKIEENILEVLDLASEKAIQFEVLGSGALSKKQPETEMSDPLNQDNEVDGSQNPT